MLNVQRRHRPPCTRQEWDQRSCAGKGAKCPILIRGTLNGSRIQLSTAKFLPPEMSRDFEAARALALEWERTGVVGRPAEYAPVAAPPPEAGDSDGTAVERAVAAYMADSRDRGNSAATLQKKATIFERRMARDPKDREGLIPSQTTSLLRYCDQKGIRFLAELDLNTIRDWRGTWKVNSLVRQKRQGQVLGFLWFCERAGWLPRNYASDITRGLGRIQVKATQTGYFQPHEYKAVIDATYLYSDRPSIDKHNSLTIGGERIRSPNSCAGLGSVYATP
jgi:integrase/recombinase XerD